MREIVFAYPLNDTIQCPIGIDANDPHEFEQGTGRLAFYDIMGKAGHYHEVCLECAHPMNEPVVDGGLELAPDLAIYSVRVDGIDYHDHALTARQAMDIAYQWEINGSVDVAIYIYKDSSQASYSWSEMAELSHTSQVAMFGWCGCEDNDGQDNPYPNCPK